MADLDIISENLAELLTNTVDMATVFYDIFLNPNPMMIHLKAFDDNNELIDVEIPNRAMDRITPYIGEGSPEGKVAAPVGSAYVDTMSSTVYYKVSGDADDPYGWNAVISQSLMETFIRTYLEARGYITTSSLRTYLVTHEYVDVPYLSSYLDSNGYIRGGDLDTVSSANTNDKMIVINGDTDDIQGIALGNLISSMISSEEGNSLTRGTDNKLFVDDGVTGVVAGTYVYPKNLVVNQNGRITSVEQGSQSDITIATDVNYGIVRPDNTSIVVNDGVISSIARNVGEIISSTIPINNAGVHLLDGALLPGDGIYKEFYEYMASLWHDGYTQLFWGESDWQSYVTNHGVCGKFVLNEANRTIRLPKVTGIIEGTIDVTALGDLVEAGLPVMTTGGAGSHSHSLWAECWRGADGNNQAARWCGGDRRTGSATGWTNTVGDHTHSINTGVGVSNTVQPQTIKVLYYIVVANVTKPSMQIDIDNITTDLNGKAETDLTNVTDSGKILMSGMNLPSETFISLPLGPSGQTYTAPANGWVQFTQAFTGGTSSVYVAAVNSNSDGLCMNSVYSGSGNSTLNAYLPVSKGQQFKVEYVGTLNTSSEYNRFLFVYAKGSESEAS